MLKERDQHLDTIFGIKSVETVVAIENKQEIVAIENSPVVIPSGDLELRKSLEGNVNTLDILYTKLDSVLDSHSEVAKEFNKGRDVEAVAKLAQTMMEIIKENRETKEKMYKVEKNNSPPQTIGTQNNNTIQISSMRELNDLLKIQKEKTDK